VRKHPDRFVGFGSVPLQSVPDAIAIAREAKAMGLKGLEIGNAVGDKPLDDPMFEPFFQAAQELDMLLFVDPLEGGLDADDPLSPILGNALQFTFRTTMMVERMILTGMFEKYPNLKLCLSHGGGLLAFNIWRLDHSYGLRADLQKQVPKKPSEYLKKLYFDTIVHSVAASSWNKEACSSSDWTTKYSHPLYLLETFVDRSRFLGTSYQAANWIYVGQSQGRTRNDSHKTIHVALKDIYLYPLTARWRELLRL
jgi:Amidohydrolase/Domain of unknown function (DUF4338)